ncbi:MAG: TonB-dependent receptor plug domain-containing protein, partial [Prolixibacteraceae bacterium]|nr:TonB-dependent receptor plug domain-containing protein [Prolixibacteraceae bacterium]
ATYIGYQATSVSINPDDQKMVNLYLVPGIDLDEVEIKTPFFSERRSGGNITEIPLLEIKKMPSLLGEVDLMRTYQLLPGVQGGSEGKAGMYVRGGGPGQNLVMLDGSPLYYVNHISGFASIFDPEAVKNFKLYKGGFPARFGGRLSSVLDVQMKEGDKNSNHTFVSIGIMSGRVSTEGPLKKLKGSYFFSYRRMWLDLFMRPLSYIITNGASIGYNFYDLNGKISIQPTEKDKFYFSVYSGDDNLILKYKDEFFGPDIKAHQKVKWGNLLGVARWNHTYKPGLISDTRISFTKYRFKDADFYTDKKENIELNSFFKSRIYDFSINSDFEYFIANPYKIMVGAGITFHSFDPGMNKAVNIENSQSYIDSTYGSTSLNALEQYLYFENLINLKLVEFNIGGRLSHFLVQGKNYLYLEPRFSAGVNLINKVIFKTSYTQMHQFVNMLSNPTAGFSTDFWVPATSKIPPAMSKQYAIGFERFDNKYEVSLEFYLKKMRHLIGFKEGEIFQGSAVDWQERVEKNGVGTSKGVELFLYKKTGKLTGWISYTLAKSDRQFTNINYGERYPFKYDRRHDLSIVINFPINDYWNFSTTWVYGSGYPMTLALGKMNVINIDDVPINSTDYYNFNEVGEYYGSKNSFPMKDYHRLDIGFTRTTEKYGVEQSWTIGIYNVYNRQNPYYYFYKERKPWRGDYTTKLYQSSFLPIIPAISYSIKF